MTIPGRREAAQLLRSLEPPAWFLRHACAVADIAAWLGARTAATGTRIDVPLVEAAALLHDIDKLPAAGAPGHLPHGEGSAVWLAARGMAELGPVVRDHPVTRLADPAWEGWLRDASAEARIVAYADKRAGQRLEPMAERFASWRRRYPPRPSQPVPDSQDPPTGEVWDDDVVALVERRARALEGVVCGAAGVAPGEVGRLRWSRRALRAAS